MRRKPLSVLTVVGTRPEAIKMAPVIRELKSREAEFNCVVGATGQHRQMLDQALDLFGIRPEFDLNLMEKNQSLSSLTAALFSGLDDMIRRVSPDWVLAQGDTTTVLVAAMVSFYLRVPFGHVEAGLRTGDRFEPWPEEVNRRIADLVATLYFAPTKLAATALVSEGCDQESVIITGNTVVDAAREIAARSYDWVRSPLCEVPTDKKLVLVTAHRREIHGKPIIEICEAIGVLARRYTDKGIHFVFPVHLNPNIRETVHHSLQGISNLSLLDPLDYQSLVQLMKRSTLILTDSGGIQEEAPGFGVPVLVMRDTTERPEGIQAGVAKLVGTGKDQIVLEATKLLDDATLHSKMATCVSPYGDGNASSRIATALLKHTS